MKLDIQKELEFLPSLPEDPATTCNCCGDISHYPDMHVAAIKPFTDQEITCDFVACSSTCVKTFKLFPNLENYIARCLEEVITKFEKDNKKLSLTIPYKLLLYGIRQKTLSN